MKVTLTYTTKRTLGDVGDSAQSTTTLEGTTTEIQQALDQLFDAPRAAGMRQEFGLKVSPVAQPTSSKAYR